MSNPLYYMQFDEIISHYSKLWRLYAPKSRIKYVNRHYTPCIYLKDILALLAAFMLSKFLIA